MKKRIGILCLLIIMLGVVSFAAYPEELENQELQEMEDFIPADGARDVMEISENYEEANGETNIIDDDLYLLKNDVYISDTVNGNVYAMGKTVKMNEAVVYGNVYVMGETIELSNVEVSGSVYILGKNVKFSGTAYDVYSAGSQVDFSLESYIWRDVRTIAEVLNLSGNVYRNAYVSANQLFISETTVIDGNLEYYSTEEIEIPEAAQIDNVEFNQLERNTEKTNASDYIFQVITVAFTTAIIALILLFIIGKFFVIQRNENIAKDLLVNVGKGLLIFIAFPIVAGILFVTSIGASLGIVTLFIYIILLCLATTIGCVEIANRIVNKAQGEDIKKGKLVGISVLVSLAVWVVGLIPTLGSIVKMIIALIGLGMFANLMLPVKKNDKE